MTHLERTLGYKWMLDLVSSYRPEPILVPLAANTRDTPQLVKHLLR